MHGELLDELVDRRALFASTLQIDYTLGRGGLEQRRIVVARQQIDLPLLMLTFTQALLLRRVARLARLVGGHEMTKLQRHGILSIFLFRWVLILI